MPAYLHVILSAVLIVLSLAAVATVVGAGGAHPLPVRDLRVTASPTAAPQIPKERALDAVVAGLDEVHGDPFHLGGGHSADPGGSSARVPRPPAPPLAFPTLPPLPLPVQ